MLSLKQALIRRLRAELEEEIAALQRVSYPPADADSAARQPPAAAPPDSDEAERIRDLEHITEALAALPLQTFNAHEPIAMSAIIDVELEGRRLHCFLAPQGGGMKVDLYGKEIQVITPSSPVGQALLSRKVGEVVEVRTQAGLRGCKIIAIV